MCIWYLLASSPACTAARQRRTQAGLLLGSISLLYSHYLGALLLPVLGLFHLLFVPKHRRWWRPVTLFGARHPGSRFTDSSNNQRAGVYCQ